MWLFLRVQHLLLFLSCFLLFLSKSSEIVSYKNIYDAKEKILSVGLIYFKKSWKLSKKIVKNCNFSFNINLLH